MQRLTAQGQQRVADLAHRYGVSTDAVMTLLAALMAGQGTMAQFNHPDLGGSGQWMQGGMTMVGDMFNHALKAKVDGICAELSQLLAQQPGVTQPLSSLAQRHSQEDRPSARPEVSLFVPTAPGATSQWWPEEFGMPSSTGTQNNLRYAYFPALRRLVIDRSGQVTVYDTLAHQIHGVAQQQSAGASLTLTIQYGVVPLASLPLVSVDGVPQAETGAAQTEAPPARSPQVQAPEEILATIERLAALHQQGILSEAEFTAKKTELLQRL